MGVSIGTLAGPIIGTTSIPMVPTGTTNSIPPPLSTTTITGPTSTVGAVASATVSMIPTYGTHWYHQFHTTTIINNNNHRTNLNSWSCGFSYSFYDTNYCFISIT